MEKLKFLDKFVRIYGFHSLADYTTEINSSELSSVSGFLDEVNSFIPSIKELFRVSQMNLARKQYHVDSALLAISLLKHCLKQSGVPYEIRKTPKRNVLRLIPQNKILMEYISNMDDNIHTEPELTRSAPLLSSVNTARDVIYRDFLKILNPIDYVKVSEFHPPEPMAALARMPANWKSHAVRYMTTEFMNKSNLTHVEREGTQLMCIKLPRTADMVEIQKVVLIDADGFQINELEWTVNLLDADFPKDLPVPQVALHKIDSDLIIKSPVSLLDDCKIAISYRWWLLDTKHRTMLAVPYNRLICDSVVITQGHPVSTAAHKWEHQTTYYPCAELLSEFYKFGTLAKNLKVYTVNKQTHQPVNNISAVTLMVGDRPVSLTQLTQQEDFSFSQDRLVLYSDLYPFKLRVSLGMPSDDAEICVSCDCKTVSIADLPQKMRLMRDYYYYPKELEFGLVIGNGETYFPYLYDLIADDSEVWRLTLWASSTLTDRISLLFRVTGDVAKLRIQLDNKYNTTGGVPSATLSKICVVKANDQHTLNLCAIDDTGCHKVFTHLTIPVKELPDHPLLKGIQSIYEHSSLFSELPLTNTTVEAFEIQIQNL